MMLQSNVLTRESAFSYRCNGCSQCCHYKRIQTNPYEVLRLSRNKGLTTGEFTRRYLESKGPYLKMAGDGACAFLDGRRCSVHADRPLACRIYPLGRWVSAEGEETFRELQPHPKTAGVYGEEGTVADFLDTHGAQIFMHASMQYQTLFYRLFDALRLALPQHETVAEQAQDAMFTRDAGGVSAFMEWLDVDSTVTRYCAEHCLAVPTALDAIVKVHILAIDQWLDRLSGEIA